jgi:tetratricopeptide (TPR) repeat protein
VEYQDEDSASADDTEDPYTGRIGLEIIPGVYAARCQAIYTSGECTIKVFAYVYAPDLPDREMWECYLRLHMLSSFVHEASHHYDSTERIARGRWRMDNRRKVEAYAEDMQRDWMRDYVLPYIETTYPDQVQKLMDWIEHYGGYKLPLSMISGDPRASWNDDTVSGVSLLFSVSSNIGYLAKDVYQSKGLNKARIGFAHGLHYGEHYEPALQIIERVLADSPDDLDALTLKADIYIHQEMYTEARVLVDRVLKQNPDHKDALWVQMDVCQETQDWQGLLNTSGHVLSHFELEFWGKIHVTFHRAKACLELRDFDGMNTDLEAIEKSGWSSRGIPKYEQRKIDELRAEAGRRGMGVSNGSK